LGYNNTSVRRVLRLLRTEKWSEAASLLKDLDTDEAWASLGRDGTIDAVLGALPLLEECGLDDDVESLLRRITPHRPYEAFRAKAGFYASRARYSELLPLLNEARDSIEEEQHRELVDYVGTSLLVAGKSQAATDVFSAFRYVLPEGELRMWSRYGRADRLAAQGRYDESTAVLKDVVDEAEGRLLAPILALLGRNALERGDFAGAKAIYERMLSEFACDEQAGAVRVGARLSLATALHGIGDTPGARALFECVRSDPEASASDVSSAEDGLVAWCSD